jgi:hypothetical protein
MNGVEKTLDNDRDGMMELIAVSLKVMKIPEPDGLGGLPERQVNNLARA